MSQAKSIRSNIDITMHLYQDLIRRGYRFSFTSDRRVRVDYHLWVSKGAETTFSFGDSFTLHKALIDHSVVTWLIELGVP